MPYHTYPTSCATDHNTTLINKKKFLNNADYIIRIIYKYSY